MRMSESIKELSSALAKFQGDVRNPNNEATNPQFRSKYAPLDVVINTVKPLLAKYGLSFIQSTSTQEEMVGVTTLLMHDSGEWIESDTLYLPAYQSKSGGVKEFNAQAIGSSTTYGRRYQLSAILGISSEDDDDGNSVSGYKDSSNNKPNNNSKASDEEKEKKRQEALAKAQARQNANKPETPSAPPKEEPDSVEMILPAQKTAIGNLVKIVARAKGFDAVEYEANLIAVHGAKDIDSLTQVQAKAVIQQINEDKKK